MELTTTMADFLEDEVDEKFYISDTYIKYAEESSTQQTDKGNGFKFEPKAKESIAKSITSKAGQRMTDNFVQENIPVIVKDCGKTISKATDVASTVLARDYKGWNNYGMNGVLEYKL